MSALVRDADWAATPLGPMDQWPQALRVAVDICLNSRFPMFVWWGPALVNLYNDAYAPLLGKRHPAALGRPARDIWGEIWDVIGPQVEGVLKRGEATWFERVPLVVERNGYAEEAYFTWSHSPIRGDDGRIAGLFGVVTEDTARVSVERERDQLDAQRKLALDAARMGWWHYDPLTQVSKYDDRFKEIFGVEGNERPNEQILRRIHAEDLPGVWAAVAAALDPADPKPYSTSYRVIRDDGSIRWVEAHGLATFEGEGTSRQAVSFVGTVADVTERRRGDEQARTILESITDAFFAVDRAWRFSYLNKQAERVLNQAPGQLLGKVLWEVYPGLAGSEFERMYHRAMDQGIAGTATLYYPDHERWYEVWAYPAIDGVSIYFRDVTEQQRAAAEREQLLTNERAARAEAERANAAKDEFLAALSHELRTPLTPVLLTASVMESHPGLPEELRADVAMIRRNVELESRLISDLLDVTRIIRGKLQLDLTDVDLHAVIRAAADICQRESPTTLSMELAATRHVVRGDRTRLQQIFWNLINNAIKFTPAGGRITVRSTDGTDGRIQVEVADTGAGIDPSILPRLFDAFEQGDVRTFRQQAGLGLGLTISRRLAEAHGGTITAASPGRGQGATFTVDLPALDTKATSPTERRSPVRIAPAAATKPLAILLVEDHEATLKVMTKLLKAAGHQVTGVSSVAAGLAAAGAARFELIISDLGLPDGSGLDLMRQLRADYAGRAIAITGYGMDSDVAATREAGFAEHLTKPVDFAALQAAIRRVAG